MATQFQHTMTGGYRRKPFPRPGAWAIVDDRLCIIASLGLWKIETVPKEVPNPAQPGETMIAQVKVDVLDAEAPYAEVHFVDTSDGPSNGDTIEQRKNVPFPMIAPAPYQRMRAVRRAQHVTAEHAQRLGYPVDASE